MNKKKKKTVFITGGAGFIGQAVARRFARAGYRVKTFDLLPPPEKIGEHITGTIMYPAELYAAMKGADYVLHLAAMLGVARTEAERLQCLSVNINGTAYVLEAAVKAKIAKVIFASSSEVYGEPDKTPISEEDKVFPKSVYAVSKLAGEELMRAYHQTHGLAYSIVRFFNVYGPGQVAEFVVPNFLRAALQNRPIPINGDGTQVRSFCFVDDAAEGVFLAMENRRADGHIFNIGNDTASASLVELAHKVLALRGKGKNAGVRFLKASESDRKSEREIQRRTADIRKARTILNYRPRVSLDKGLSRTFKSGRVLPPRSV